MTITTRKGGRKRRFEDSCGFCNEPKVTAIAGVSLGERCVGKITEIAEAAGVEAHFDLLPAEPRRRTVSEASCRCGKPLPVSRRSGLPLKHCSQKCANAAWIALHRPPKTNRRRGATAESRSEETTPAAVAVVAPKSCANCGAELPPPMRKSGRPRRYCSARCAQGCAQIARRQLARLSFAPLGAPAVPIVASEPARELVAAGGDYFTGRSRFWAGGLEL